jgi:hypothetical protein
VGKNRKPPSPIKDLLPKRTYAIDAEAFKRAAEAVRRQGEEDLRDLDKVEQLFAAEFAPLCPLTYFSLVPDRDGAFRAYIFFNTDADIERAQREGLIGRMTGFIVRSLEQFGRVTEAADARIVLRLKSDESMRSIPGAYRFRRRACEVHGPGLWPDSAND